MKFAMNGCLLLATADGSTVEMIEEIGAENMVKYYISIYKPGFLLIIKTEMT